MSTHKNTKKVPPWENVKMRGWLVATLRGNKVDKGVPIVTYVERAVMKQLEADKVKILKF